MIKVIVNADEGDVKLRIDAKLVGGRDLSDYEKNKIAKVLGRAVADSLRTLPHTDFGPENTSITFD